jgi:hypothetical protein
MPKKRNILNYCLTLFSIILVLILLEVVLPYLSIFHRVDYYAPDLVYNHAIHGYQSTHDSVGYYERSDFINLLSYNNYGRHDNHVQQKKEKKRIVTLGGSFTAGLEVPINKTWPKIFENNLNKQYEVVNFAHQAKMFNYFARYLDDDFFLEIQPDYIIFGFSYARLGGNVHYNKTEMSCQRASHYRGFSYLYGQNGDSKIKQAIDSLRSFDYFPFILYENYPKFRRSNILNFLVLQQGKRFKKNHPKFNKLRISGNNIQMLSCDKEKDIENTINDINIIKEICQKYSVPILFFFIPSETDILNNLSASQRIPLFFSENDSVIDLFDDLKNDFAQRKRPLYWKDDVHPNSEGYRSIAQSIFKHFSQWLNR